MNELTKIGVLIALILSSIGCILSILFCIAILHGKRERLGNTDVLSITIAVLQGGFALQGFITFLIRVLDNYDIDETLCRLQGYFTHLCGNLSLIVHLALALDRYVHTTSGKQMTLTSIWSIIVILSAICLASNTYLLWLPNGFAPSPSNVICVFVMIQEDGQDTLPKLGTWINTITEFLFFITLLSAYIALYFYLKRLGKNMAKREAFKANPTLRALLYRCLTIAMSFVVCWSLVILECFYMIFWNQPTSPYLDLVAMLTLLSQPIVTTLVLLHTNKVYLEFIWMAYIQ